LELKKSDGVSIMNAMSMNAQMRPMVKREKSMDVAE
jgi:hypothetical protein